MKGALKPKLVKKFDTPKNTNIKSINMDKSMILFNFWKKLFGCLEDSSAVSAASIGICCRLLHCANMFMLRLMVLIEETCFLDEDMLPFSMCSNDLPILVKLDEFLSMLFGSDTYRLRLECVFVWVVSATARKFWFSLFSCVV